MNSLTKQISGGLIVACLGMGTAFAKEYEVTITNITQGEIFTPILVASHGSDMPLFELGEAASQEVEFIAEGGDTSALNSKLISEGAYTASASGVLPPGESITLNVNTDRKHKNISVISMLVPSNDAFFAVNNIRGPKGHKSKTVYPKALILDRCFL